MTFTTIGKNTFNNFENFNNAVVNIGSTIAMILALSFTLSIIPIQKAADMWSPAIIRIYKNDKRISGSIFIISIFVILSFLSSLLRVDHIPLFCFILLAATLDMLRFYYAHVIKLLEPKQVIDSLYITIIKEINKHSKNTDKLAKIQYKMFSSEKKEHYSINTIKANLLSHSDGFYKFFYQAIDEITEIIYKAISRGEKILTKESLHILQKVIIAYINFKKDIWRQIPPLNESKLTTEDAMVRVIDYINSSLYRLSQKAMEINEESLVIEISRAYAKIARATTDLDINSEQYGELLISNYVIAYLHNILNEAKERNMLEVILQTGIAIAREATTFPPKINSAIYIKVLDLLNDSITFLFNKKINFANHLLELEQKIIEYLISQSHPQYSQIHSHISKSFQKKMNQGLFT